MGQIHCVLFLLSTMSGMACGVMKDENGLILPRKITNPCLQSTSVREVHREIRWNSNKGINVLNNKSELEKVLAKQRTASEKKQVAEKEVENEFHKMLTERGKRLEQIFLCLYSHLFVRGTV